MIYTASELKTVFKNFYHIKAAIKEGKLFKAGHGLYSDRNPFLYEMELIFAKRNDGILTLQSAFAFYGLTDWIPDFYQIATKNGAHKIKNEKVKQIYMTDDILNIGKQTIKTDWGFINIYNKERLLIELFRLKSKISYPIYKEVVNSYRHLAENDELDFVKIVQYCACFIKGGSILKKIQEVIL